MFASVVTKHTTNPAVVITGNGLKGIEMTTPTREQVVQWANQLANNRATSDDKFGIVFGESGLIKFAILARADTSRHAMHWKPPSQSRWRNWSRCGRLLLGILSQQSRMIPQGFLFSAPSLEYGKPVGDWQCNREVTLDGCQSLGNCLHKTVVRFIPQSQQHRNRRSENDRYR